MKIAVAQIACALGDVPANLDKIAAFSQRTKGERAELILFPEMADTGYAMPAVREKAQPWTQGAVPFLRDLAQRLELAIVCGVSEREGGQIYNTQVAIDAHGLIVAKYRKAHLFSPAPIAEDKCFTAGSELVTWPQLDLRFGASICYDLRFPEVYRALACERGANVFLLSSAWPFPRVEHLRVLAAARAIENQSYLLLANRVGTDDGVTFCGSSAIINPAGVVIAAASAEREELLTADVSADLIASIRTAMPVFAHRRAELYSR